MFAKTVSKEIVSWLNSSVAVLSAVNCSSSLHDENKQAKRKQPDNRLADICEKVNCLIVYESINVTLSITNTSPVLLCAPLFVAVQNKGITFHNVMPFCLIRYISNKY